MKGGECVGGRRHSWLDPYSGVCDGCGASRYQATLAHGAATMGYSDGDLREAARAAVAARDRQVTEQVRALPRGSDEEWRDDGFGGVEHFDIETVDVAAVLRLLDAG